MSDRADADTSKAEKDSRGRGRVRPRRRKRVRLALWSIFLLFDAVVIVGVALFLVSQALAGRDLPAPDWVAEEAGAVLSRGLGGGQVDVGSVSVLIPRDQALPRVIFHDVRVAAPTGAELVAVSALEVSVDKRALWDGKVQARELRVAGGALHLRRKADGSLDLGLGTGLAPKAFGSPGEVVAAVQQAFELPALAPIDRIEVEALDVFYEDLRAERSWRVSDGTMRLIQSAYALSLSVSLPLPDPETPEVASRVFLSIGLAKQDSTAEASVQIENVAAVDIAAHSPALTWLQPLNARVSGAMIASMTPAGSMGPLNGTLEIGPGVFQPETGAQPVHFDGARAYFGYRPELARLTFEEVSVRSTDGTIAANGHAYLEGIETGWPTALVGQFQFSDVRLNPPGLFPAPARFSGGSVDVKVSLAPFVARIGQLRLTTASPDDDAPPTRLSASGKVTADATGWHVVLDLGFDTVEAGPLMALWPLPLVPRTRDWVAQRLEAGTITNARLGLTWNQGSRPDSAMSFQFRDAALRPMETLPPITGATGYAAVGRQKFALTLEAGQVTPPEGGTIDLAGSTFRVNDMQQQPAVAEILWQSTSEVTAALSLLDQEPFRFLSNAGQPVTLADGGVRLHGRIAFPMKPGLTGADVDFDIAGATQAVRSDVVVPDRVLVSERLEVKATPELVRVSGSGSLDEVPLDATFHLPLGPEADEPSVEGDIEIGARFVSTFGIGLPDGSVTGDGRGDFTLTLPQGAPPSFALTSDLQGIRLGLSPLGWSKGAGQSGTLEVAGRLGERPSVDALTLKAAGLSAEGRISVAGDGGLDKAEFSKVSVGGWLDAPVLLTGRGVGRDPAVSVRGGVVDIRKTSMGGGTSSGGGASGAPMDIVLDRLIISDGISLTGFRGTLTQSSGLTGNFSGSVNGQARVTGTLSPGAVGGTAVRIRSENAGAVFKAAGVFSQGNGGSMALVLQPRRASGEYDGQLRVENVRVRSASLLTALANAISVVGLVDELNGSGILFTDVEAAFRLTPRYVQVSRASGTGPSLGISMEGIYDMANDLLDMQGVFSPVYMVNSIGSIFTRKGEGLFGFTYRMRGPASDPSVEVNPLSGFTPGMFREIFRAPPPKIRSGG